MSPNPEDRTTPSVQVPLAPFALVCLLFALASLAALVIVVSVKGVDALSTVALGLAILAFVVQIIVYIVQAAQVSEQSRQSSTLHSQMMSALAQLQERTQGTQKSMDQMNVRLLEAVIGKSSDSGVLGVSSHVAARLIETVSSSGAAHGRGRSDVLDQLTEGLTQQDYPKPLDTAEAAAIHAEMLEPISSNEVAIAEKALETLSSNEQYRLARFAFDVLHFTEVNSVLGPGSGYSTGQLLDEQLIEKIPGWKLFTLTSKGRFAGRLFTAGISPGVDAPVLTQIRQSYVDRRRTMEENASNRDR